MKIAKANQNVFELPYEGEDEQKGAFSQPKSLAVAMEKALDPADDVAVWIGKVSIPGLSGGASGRVAERLEGHGSQDYANALVTTQEFIAIRERYRLNPW